MNAISLHFIFFQNVSQSGHLDKLPVDIAESAAEGPVQPRLKVYPVRSFLEKQKGRSFQSSWYDKYSWMEYSVSFDRIYCFPCRFFGNTATHQETQFTRDGFINWKKIHDKCAKHEAGTAHTNAFTKWLNYQQ